MAEEKEIKQEESIITLESVLISKLKHPMAVIAILFVAVFSFLAFSQADIARREKESGMRTEIADSTGSKFETAVVTEITNEGSIEVGGTRYPFQEIKVKVNSGDRKGDTIEIRNDIQFGSEQAQTVFVGEELVITSTGEGEEQLYFISDKYRFPSIMLLFVVFFGLTVVFAGWKGITSIIGLGFTIYVLITYVVPSIVLGDDPMTISLIGALMIASVSMYLAHGVNKRITVALAGTLISIGIAAFLAVLFVDVARLFGTGSEEAILLTISSSNGINLKGLLLGGIIFGALGVLDDVTTAQSAAIEELKRANPKMNFKKLYESGISIGREHIVSLVNTLVLAHIGSSFPILLLFSLNNGVPLWLTFNSEFIIEEVIRTLVGSSALVLAVPITTVLAAWIFSKSGVGKDAGHAHAHLH